MTGRELILYILENRLEDKELFNDGGFMDFLTVEQAAVKMGVGTATVMAIIKLKRLPYIELGGVYYIPNKYIKEVKV